MVVFVEELRGVLRPHTERVAEHFSRSRALQERALEILQFKLDVLWALADAIMLDQCEIEIRGAKA